MKNKGFSLVELIIVIAIMAILAAAIAPALIRYIDKSRRSDDVAAAETINTAAQAALSNEKAYDEIMDHFSSQSGKVIVGSAANGTAPFTDSTTKCATFIAEVNSSAANPTSPKLKYRKNVGNTSVKPSTWIVGIDMANAKPIVWLGASGSDTHFELQPTICDEYK